MTMTGIDEWRARNAGELLARAKELLHEADEPEEQLTRTHPRLRYIIFDHGSWHDAWEMREMWAGLLVSSSVGDFFDESNLIFVGILSKMTVLEVLLLNHACFHATKVVSDDGIITAEPFECTLDELMQISGAAEVFTLDFQLDHMRALGLLQFGIDVKDPMGAPIADLTPSSLALYMYVRCHGFPGSPADYFEFD